MNAIGSRIKKFREEKGYKQELLAYEMEISQSYYSRLERNDSCINVPRLQKISKILGISISELFGETNIVSYNEIKEINIPEIEKEYIRSLKEEIFFLRKLLEEKISNEGCYSKGFRGACKG
jgi:Predicted transcription factor, homolog of eukaryotic MBF1